MDYTISDLMYGAKVMAHSVFGKKKEYNLKFNHEDNGGWYVDFPNWPFDHANLLMVSGADKLCAFLSDDDKVANVSVIPTSKQEVHEGYAELCKLDSTLTGGATYEVNGLPGFEQCIWLCLVTLFVLGECPKYMYIKKCNH